jgi:hypothetical protein
MSKQIVKVVASKDFKFFHIDAGLDKTGLQRIATETSEEGIANHVLLPALEKLVFLHFPELKHEVAIEVHITWV